MGCLPLLLLPRVSELLIPYSAVCSGAAMQQLNASQLGVRAGVGALCLSTKRAGLLWGETGTDQCSLSTTALVVAQHSC